METLLDPTSPQSIERKSSLGGTDSCDYYPSGENRKKGIAEKGSTSRQIPSMACKRESNT